MQTLREIALQYPEAQEGVVCAKSSFKARNKAFLYLGVDNSSFNAMLKLCQSLPEATRLAASEPECYKVGVHGWVTATFRHEQSPPPGLLERWIDESYRLLVPKQLVATLAEHGILTTGPTGTAAKMPAGKKKRTSR